MKTNLRHLTCINWWTFKIIRTGILWNFISKSCFFKINIQTYTLTVSKVVCETEQELYCHEICLEAALKEPQDLYLRCL